MPVCVYIYTHTYMYMCIYKKVSIWMYIYIHIYDRYICMEPFINDSVQYMLYARAIRGCIPWRGFLWKLRSEEGVRLQPVCPDIAEKNLLVWFNLTIMPQFLNWHPTVSEWFANHIGRCQNFFRRTICSSIYLSICLSIYLFILLVSSVYLSIPSI